MATYERRSSSESEQSHEEDTSHLSSRKVSQQENNKIDLNSQTEAGGMDRFQQKLRNELMFELRRIQHGERPVTGQNHREQLQEFMAKHLVGQAPDCGAAGKGNIPANVDSVEKHRPEAVVVEVQGIVEQRPVSSILQSAAFRRQLENVIRGSITNTRRQAVREPSSRPSHQTIPVTSAAADTEATGSRSTSSSQLPAGRPVPLPRRQLVRSESTESVESFSSARSSLEEDIEDDVDEGIPSETPVVPVSQLQQESRLVSQQQPESRPVPQAQPIILTENRHRDNPGERIGWNEISRIQREEMVEEISELLHRRLVSSTLDGEFRATLELHMQEHVSSTGTNGEAVQDFIRSLPNAGVPHNDFSHLGIPAGQDTDNWDNISVTSVSAHSVPYIQTNTYLSREIQSLRSQMNEMKNMLKLTFDLQMDIQRAVRQEVAAAIGQSTGQGTANIGISPTSTPRPISDTHCLICLERHTDTVLYQCGHMCVCYACGRDLVSRGHNCPVCRAPIRDVIRAYRTNAE